MDDRRAVQTSRDVRRAYDTSAAAYRETIFTDPAADRAVRRVFAERATSPVLDAGCGPGRLVPELAAAGLGVVGADLSPAMVRLARHDHPALPCCVADLTAPPFAAASFGGVLAWYALIHLQPTDRAAALAALATLLRPGAPLLVAAQVGAGTRQTRGYGTGAGLTAYLVELEELASEVVAAGLTVLDAIRREPVDEPHPQCFVLAVRGRPQ